MSETNAASHLYNGTVWFGQASMFIIAVIVSITGIILISIAANRYRKDRNLEGNPAEPFGILCLYILCGILLIIMSWLWFFIVTICEEVAILIGFIL